MHTSQRSITTQHFSTLNFVALVSLPPHNFVCPSWGRHKSSGWAV